MEVIVHKSNHAILLFIWAILYQIQHTYGMDAVYTNQEKHISKLQDLVKHPVAAPNNLLKTYETELDYGFKPISIIVLEGVIDPRTVIRFKELGVKNDKGMEFKFDSNLNNVKFGSELKNHKPQGSNTRRSIVTIESQSQGLEICLDAHACRLAHYGHGSINKIETSNFALTNVSYYTETPNDPDIGQYEMKCSKTACDISKMKKKGKSFIFSRHLPTYKKRAHINLEESYKDIALHMDIRQDQKAVIFNTRNKDGWNRQEERQYTFSFVKGHTYTIAFNIQNYGVTVSVNGMFLHYYKHRMNPERIKKLWFSWDQEAGNYSFIGKDELGSSKLLRSAPLILQVEPTTTVSSLDDFEFIDTGNKAPESFDLYSGDRLTLTTTTGPEILKIELPKPSKQILSYNTDLVCGFAEGSSLNFRGIVRNNSSIKLEPIGENFEVRFTFNLKLNRVEMETRDARDESKEYQTFRLKEEKEMEFYFTSQHNSIEVCADEQCVVFKLLSEVNHVEFSNTMISDISYYAKTKQKLQPVHHKMNCSVHSCEVGHLQKYGSIFTFAVKLPVNETWFRVDFRESDKVVPFHMSVGTADVKTVFEAIDPEVDFSREEIDSLPLSSGQTHIFKFYIQIYGTLASVDGYYFHFFRHKLDPELIIDIQYEWELLDASYHNDRCYEKPPAVSEDYLSSEIYEDY